MLGRKQLYVVLGAAGALVLLLGGLVSVSVVFAREITPESEDTPGWGFWGWGRGLFGFGRGDSWTMFDTAADVLGEAMRDAITQAVEDGRISQEQADWLLEGLEQGFTPG
ncbi:MAG: hypothetical protein PVF54_11010 [Anaerolineae bacterium]|jgi:hypothetical protein